LAENRKAVRISGFGKFQKTIDKRFGRYYIKNIEISTQPE
jgi:nucleoid DNA-binding protein